MEEATQETNSLEKIKDYTNGDYGRKGATVSQAQVENRIVDKLKMIVFETKEGEEKG